MKREITTDEAAKIVRVLVLSQSLIHQLDELTLTNLYRQNFKSKINGILRFLELQVDPVLSSAAEGEKDYYSMMVQEIDKMVETIKVTKDVN